MPISAVAVRQAKPREKPYRLYDALGLYLEVGVTGSKYWRLKYRFDGREKLLSFGRYLKVSLAQARLRRAEAKVALTEGRDPGARMPKPAARTFEAVARDW